MDSKYFFICLSTWMAYLPCSLQESDGHMFLEAFSPVYKHARDFLIAIAEVILILHCCDSSSVLCVTLCSRCVDQNTSTSFSK